MKSKEDLNKYKEMGRLMRRMGDFMDELYELHSTTPSEVDALEKEEEILGRYMVVAKKIELINESM